ncbi:aldo/keto reductase [Actinopolyspora halophila]|uniref:aldo/keto reductase n=1 Tax=Actinopolyspora halophila TaxID=1850 RepID=UPI00037D69E7|nr:aldo/keto reductase [Actinopolyspora halophila]
MRYRLLGRTGLRVSEFFLGAMHFSGRDGGVSREEAERVVDTYAEAGGNVVDTAVTYGNGHSEELVGEILEGRRDRFVLSTKYGMSRDGADPNAAGNHRKNLVRSLESSLRKLRTDHIDLYWVHLWDRNTPLEETMRALDDVVRSGKVLYVGISDTPAWVVARANTLAEWKGWTPFAGLQVPYNLLNRDVERELLPMAEELGLTLAAWSPLAHGKLAGKGDSGSASAPGQDRERAVLEELRAVAEELGATSGQVALSWLRKRSGVVHPILGASRAHQLASNLEAPGTDLAAEHVRRLDESTRFSPGFPGDFLRGLPEWVWGEANGRLDGR